MSVLKKWEHCWAATEQGNNDDNESYAGFDVYEDAVVPFIRDRSNYLNLSISRQDAVFLCRRTLKELGAWPFIEKDTVMRYGVLFLGDEGDKPTTAYRLFDTAAEAKEHAGEFTNVVIFEARPVEHGTVESSTVWNSVDNWPHA